MIGSTAYNQTPEKKIVTMTIENAWIGRSFVFRIIEYPKVDMNAPAKNMADSFMADKSVLHCHSLYANTSTVDSTKADTNHISITANVLKTTFIIPRLSFL